MLYVSLKRTEAERREQQRMANLPPMQMDDVAIRLLECIDAHSDEVPNIARIVDGTGINFDTVRDHLTLLVSRNLVKIIRARSDDKIEDGRFTMNDGGRTILASRRIALATKAKDSVKEPMIAVGKTVFIAHGRDRAQVDKVKAYMYELKADLEPIVLEDKAFAGRTIIEKFEAHAGAAFAIVVLSADDAGCLKEDWPNGAKPRARQNAIFEAGYLFGKIGRNHVAILITREEIEKPTNVDGIGWIYLDEHGGWKLKLQTELRAAGLIA